MEIKTPWPGNQGDALSPFPLSYTACRLLGSDMRSSWATLPPVLVDYRPRRLIAKFGTIRESLITLSDSCFELGMSSSVVKKQF